MDLANKALYMLLQKVSLQIHPHGFPIISLPSQDRRSFAVQLLQVLHISVLALRLCEYGCLRHQLKGSFLGSCHGQLQESTDRCIYQNGLFDHTHLMKHADNLILSHVIVQEARSCLQNGYLVFHILLARNDTLR